MNKEKEIRKQLERLGSNKVYIEYLERELQMLEEDYGLQGIAYDGIGGGSGTSDSTGDAAIRMNHIKNELENKKKKKENEIQHITDALGQLTELEFEIVQMFYIDRVQLCNIGSRVGYSLSQVRRIKNDSMIKLKIAMFGDFD